MLHPALPNQRPHPSVFPNLYAGLAAAAPPQAAQNAWSQFLPFYSNYPTNLLPGTSQHNIDQIAMALMKPSRGGAVGHAPSAALFNSPGMMQKPFGSSGLPTPLPSSASQISLDHSARFFQHGFLPNFPNSSGVRFPTSTPNAFQHLTLFQKGTPIRLSSGEIRSVEDMKTDDFYKNIERYPNQKVEKTAVRRIDKNYSTGKAIIEFQIRSKMVTHETFLGNPFYVVDMGWSSCDPEKSLQLFNIQCNKLEVDDQCLVRLEVGKSAESTSLIQTKLPTETDLSKLNPFGMHHPIFYPKGTDMTLSPHNKLNNRRQLLDPYSRPLHRKSESQSDHHHHHSAFSPPTTQSTTNLTNMFPGESTTRVSSSSSSNPNKSNSFSVANLMQASDRDG